MHQPPEKPSHREVVDETLAQIDFRTNLSLAARELGSVYGSAEAFEAAAWKLHTALSEQGESLTEDDLAYAARQFVRQYPAKLQQQILSNLLWHVTPTFRIIKALQDEGNTTIHTRMIQQAREALTQGTNTAFVPRQLDAAEQRTLRSLNKVNIGMAEYFAGRVRNAKAHVLALFEETTKDPTEILVAIFHDFRALIKADGMTLSEACDNIERVRAVLLSHKERFKGAFFGESAGSIEKALDQTHEITKRRGHVSEPAEDLFHEAVESFISTLADMALLHEGRPMPGDPE